MIRLARATKLFGSVCAVRDVDLILESGTFFTLFGPSGGGETIPLRIISGFETPTEGRVFLDGEDVTYRAPEKREVGMVFQGDALFPHMAVAENVAYGLRVRHLGSREIRERVAKYLALDGIVDFEQFNGVMSFFPVRVSGRLIRVLRAHDFAATDDFRVGDRVFLTIDPKSLVVVAEA